MTLDLVFVNNNFHVTTKSILKIFDVFYKFLLLEFCFLTKFKNKKKILLR